MANADVYPDNPALERMSSLSPGEDALNREYPDGTPLVRVLCTAPISSRGGVSALTSGIIVREPARRSAADTVILNDTRINRHHGCNLVMGTLEEQLVRIGCRITATAPAHRDWRCNERVLHAMERARLVVVNAEGTIHHDRPAGTLLLEAGRYAASRRIPIVLLNCGWQANGPGALEMLRQFSLVAVRDSMSQKELGSSGIPCRLVPDLSLYHHDVGKAKRSGVGFTDSVDRATSLSLERSRRACGGVTVPIQFSRGGASEAYRFFRSYVGLRDLAHPAFLTGMLRLRARQFRSQRRTERAFLDLLASLELLVSGRFHACTLALLAGTPFVAAATNTRKITALVEDAGLSAWRANAALTPAEIHEASRNGWEQDEEASIADFLADARTRIDSLFSDIAILL